ncbi:nicotinic acid mononucleotide adenyltransferase [Capnocytophaga sp.]|uniref:nicotinic acid mononucleotide adenyltransferase n=1 Tax=Capnocytophaga sp. TaxID=44737 RepID=UPI0026DB0547|nr:nicotinic acid mononucleotide adenyltransferase [Capnocytophaga sp.]MDO5106357.1 nicotinic acid mononucleotide adenyltransferase [Capnocytophaga sp.]
MKRWFALSLVLALFLSGCSTRDYDERPLSLHELLHSYGLWYVEVNATLGRDRIPFMQKAFTLSFDRGVLLANNNLVGIGSIGGGYGREIGRFSVGDPFLEIYHNFDGAYRFKVVQVAVNEIDLVDMNSDVIYHLKGYHRHNFNYDQLFLDNISYFLQEYAFWEKTFTSRQGIANPFDAENFIVFYNANGDFIFETKDHITRPTPIFRGLYSVDNMRNNSNLKLLTLHYGNGREHFEVRVLNDQEIELFHLNSQTVYRFRGVRNIVYKAAEQDKKVTPVTF